MDLATPSKAGASATGAQGRGVLSCRSVRKSFQVGNRKLEVLHGVNLELARGEVLALMGASGAGKSTLLHVLGLLDRPDEGKVMVDGTDGWSLPIHERAELRNAKIGFVFQFYHLLPELTALENVLLPAMIANKRLAYLKRRGELKDRALSLLESVGMQERLRHRPPQLSGGERQRVALARALFHDPPILIADEPTGNLDRNTGDKVLELLFEAQAQRGNSLLLVTHDERLARRCGRVVFMEDGLILGDTAAGVPDA
jgi:lipoprotein-releasing system ATP-binding protein